MGILTLAELEATTSLGTTRLFTFNGTGVTRHEAFSTECLLVFSVHLHQSTCNSEAKSLALTRKATATEVHLDVILFSHIKKSKGLLYNVLQNGRREIIGEIALVDGDLAVPSVM